MSTIDFAIYEQSPGTSNCLRQGELLTGITRLIADVSKIGDSQPSVVKVDYSIVVVVSQACDLAQDYKARSDGKSQLPDTLFCHVPTAEQLKSTEGINSKIWERIKLNKDERYHFLEKLPSGCDTQGIGLPELGIDFKRYFTIPTDEVYRYIALGIAKRRAVLCSPYLEHLSSRFAYFLSRVGLPHDHSSE